MINFAYSLYISQPLTFKIEMPKFDNIKTEFLTEEQYASLLDVLKNEDNVEAACLMKIALSLEFVRWIYSSLNGEILISIGNSFIYEHQRKNR